MTRTWIIISILVFTSVCWLSGCSEDCPTCPDDEKPEPYKGWLYFTELIYARADLYKVDMETDSIVDSVSFPAEAGTGAMAASPDGRYLVTIYSYAFEPGACRIYDAQTLEQLAEIQRPITPWAFDEDGSLLATWAEFDGVPDANLVHVERLSVPGLSVISEDTFRDVHALKVVDRVRNRIFFAGGHVRGLNSFWMYDYSQRTFSRIPIRLSPSDTIQIAHVSIFADGDRLLFIANSVTGMSWLGCWSIGEDSLLWKVRRLTHYGGLALSPDETEIWSTDPGIPDIFDQGTIFIHDATTGAYLGGISLHGYFSSQSAILKGDWLLFSPNGDKVYMSSGAFVFSPGGSLLAIDRERRTVTKIFAPNFDSAPGYGVICPKS